MEFYALRAKHYEINFFSLYYFVCVCRVLVAKISSPKKKTLWNIKKVMNVCIRLPHKECFSNPILQSIVRDLKSDFSLNFLRKTQSRKIGVFISLPSHKIRWVIEKDYIEMFPTQINHHRILRETVCNAEGFRFNREAVQEDKSDLDAIERDFTLKIETYAFRMLNFNIRIFSL